MALGKVYSAYAISGAVIAVVMSFGWEAYQHSAPILTPVLGGLSIASLWGYRRAWLKF